MINQTAHNALNLMTILAASPNGQPIIMTELAEPVGTSAMFLAKIVSTLTRAKLTKTQPGRGGGVSLTRPASKITLLEIINAVAPIERTREAQKGAALAPLHAAVDKVYANVNKQFASITLADVASRR